MAHRLTDIRKALVAVFKNATAAGPNVWDNRARRFCEGRLPAIHIATLRRSTDVLTDLDILQHRAEFSIALVVQSDDTADDTAEAMLDQVEKLLQRNPTLNGLTTLPITPQVLEVGFDGDGERVVAVYVLNVFTAYQEEPWVLDDVTEPATRPDFANPALGKMALDFDIPPFSSVFEHQQWLANNYATSKPDMQGATPLKGV